MTAEEKGNELEEGKDGGRGEEEEALREMAERGSEGVRE